MVKALMYRNLSIHMVGGMFRLFAGITFGLFLLGCSQAKPVAVVTEEATMVSEMVEEQDVVAVVSAEPQLSILIDGLQNPVGIAVLPDGGLLIAEEGSGERDDSAGVMLVAADGSAGRLISGLHSGRDSGDLSGVPFVAVSPDGKTIYTSYFGLGHLLTLPLDGALRVPDQPLGEADLGVAMLPLNAVKIANPFDLTFDPDGLPVVSDATGNGVAKQTADGKTRFFHRFEELPNPAKASDTIDAVPTGIERVGEKYYVTLTGGCPFPAGSGQLVAIDENRGQITLLRDLNMPIDVAQAGDGTIWVLEFAQFDPEGSCFSGSGYLPNSGRLSKLVDGKLQVVLTELNYPGSITFSKNGTAYISEVFAGRVLQIAHINQIDQPISAQGVLHKLSAEISIPTPIAAEPAPPANSPTAAFFKNEAAARGLNFHQDTFATGLSKDPVAMMGGGLCWIDYDNDGWLDIYYVNSYANAEIEYWQEQGGLPTNALFKNVNGQFSDVSAGSGTDLSMRGNGCVAADFDMDGWIDLYVTADGPNALLWNNGDGTFREAAVEAGVAAPEWNSATAVTDLNGDGLPDMFVAAYISLDNKVEKPVGAFPQDFYGLPDHLYLNNGDGTFRDVIDAVGMSREERGLGAIFSDLDRDGDVELYIANDGHPNRLYSVERDTSELGFAMIDLSPTSQTGNSGSGMGLTSGDYNGDGQPDLFVTNWRDELNGVYRNEGGDDAALLFRDRTAGVGISGLGNGVTAWGVTWADFDHDTDEDLIIVHGQVPIKDPAQDALRVRFYGNRLAEGKPDQWRDWTNSVGFAEDGLGKLMARGSAVADFDNDGDLDVAVNTISGEAVLLVNGLISADSQQAINSNWLQIAFSQFTPNARATITLSDGRQLVRELYVGSSYLASEDPRIHFGLADFSQVERVEVSWGNGETAVFENIESNQVLEIP